MYNVVKEYKDTHNIQLYDNQYLVLHLRAGDAYKRFGLGNTKIYNEIQKNIDEYISKYNTIKYIVIITALHYGHTNFHGLYATGSTFPTKYIYRTDNHDENIISINEFIKKQKLPVILQSSDNIDHDFTSLSTCKYLIISQGAFSKLIKKINEMFN